MYIYLQEIGEFVGVMGIDVSVDSIQNIFQKHNVSWLISSDCYWSLQIIPFIC